MTSISFGWLQYAHPLPAGDSNHTQATLCSAWGTIAIRASSAKCNSEGSQSESRQPMPTEALTARELEVLQLIVDGYSNSTIARKLYITEGTVKTHVHSVLKKLYVRDRTQAAIRALRSGLAR